MGLTTWSKLKKQFESRLAAKLAGRIEIHCTGYPHSHDEEKRAWIEIDGRLIQNFTNNAYLMRQWYLKNELEKNGEEPAKASQKATERLREEGLFSLNAFLISLNRFGNLSIEAALDSPDPLIRTWAVIDRRVGRHRLLEIEVRPDDPALLQTLLALRLNAEGLE